MKPLAILIGVAVKKKEGPVIAKIDLLFMNNGLISVNVRRSSKNCFLKSLLPLVVH